MKLNGWIKTIDQLPTLDDADDAGHVYQCVKTDDGFKFLNDCHFFLLKMDADRNCISEKDYWHPKPKAPKLPIEDQSH